jgi:eukaryotic-like serine/threonine-protein kinase
VVKTKGNRACPVCGALFPDNSDSCPVCALRAALGNEPTIGESSVEPSLLGSQLRFEHYEILTYEDGTPLELGRGAMGVTYKAVDVNLRRTVALKVISARFVGDESARRRFVREARAAASVRHPNVASVFHLGKSGDSYFYAMEFVDGEPLDKLIRRFGRLETKLALEIAAQVAGGLAAIHEQNLVHRDIKPSNVMVKLKGDGSIAKIIDLGLAKGVTESRPETAISIPGSFAGTPEFASPEQFAGVSVDIRSDLYSLGMTLWGMLTARTPFRGTPGEVMYQHQHAPLPIDQLERVPQPVVVLLEMLLEKDPAWRFQNPTDLLKVLPVVLRAVKARRTIKPQQLRSAFGRQLSCEPKELPEIRVPKRSIAVLPFDTLGHAKGNTYFADGVQDEILSNLAKVSQLKVISRTSVMTYRPGANRNLRSIANSLGVANVVEGTVRRHGNRIRLTSKLIDARTDEIVWSETYERDLTDIFAIQSEIAQAVASKLRASLSPHERRQVEEKPTNDLEAYDLYLQAKELMANAELFAVGDRRQSVLCAIDLLGEATKRDPNFALAYCLITRGHDNLYAHSIDEDVDRRALGDAAIKRALRLRPDLPEVHLTFADHLYMVHRDYERAAVQIAIAERDLPNSPWALIIKSAIDRRRGRWDASTKSLEEAARLDPRNPAAINQLQFNYSFLRRFREWEQICDRLIQLAPGKPIFKANAAGATFAKTADVTKYRAVLETLRPALEHDIEFTSLRLLAAVYGRDWTAAKAILSNCPAKDFLLPPEWQMIPKDCMELWISRLEGGAPKMEGRFAMAREQLNRKVGARPEDALLLSSLSLIDAALNLNQEAVEEAKRAMAMRPISADARDGPNLVNNSARVFALTNEPDLAFESLDLSVRTPGGVYYSDLKLDPALDSLRADPRFEKLLVELAPKD